jgi:hypothetical protein
MKSFNIAVAFVSPVTASLVTFVVYWAQGNRLEPARVFASLGLLHILRMRYVNSVYDITVCKYQQLLAACLIHGC